MHVIKPQALGLSSRPIEFRKRFGLSVSGYLHVPFAQAAKGSLWSEQSMWNFLGREMPLPLIDEGIAKTTSEYLVHGSAYTTADRREAVAVQVRLGDLVKTVLVFGDRHWAGAQQSRPQPFTSQPLVWERAYGGTGFAPNPQGIGLRPIDGVHRLPNLELPTDRPERPGVDVAPAGFGMLDVMHPQRAALRGTYDEAWLEDHSPGFAPDTDWRYFNMAPRDQWFERQLVGDEAYALNNLHPTRPGISGRLPGFRVRAFTSYGAGPGAAAGDRLREVKMHLTTVWFFPHAERMVLVFHGLAETAHDDACDVLRLMGGVERLGEPRPPEHYLEVMAKRLDARLAIVHALNDTELMPVGIDSHDPEVEQAHAVMRPEGLRENAQYRRAQIDVELARDLVRSNGKDPDALGIRLAPREKPPTVPELPAYLEKLQKEMDAQKWAALADAVTHTEQAIELMKLGKIDPAASAHRGPPKFRAREQLAEIAHGYALADLSFDPRTMAPKLSQQELMLHIDYLQGAHQQPPAPRLEGKAAQAARGEVEWLLGRGVKAWPGIDLTGVDLSGLDLSGIQLHGAWLESADLRNSRLCGTDFSSAVLAHADLRGADATGACFKGANLGRAQLARATLDLANFDQALLANCALGQTQLRGASLTRTDLLDTTWGAANWRSAVGSGLLFYKLDLRGLRLPAAQLASTSFIQCDLRGVEFAGARLSGCSFVGCNADGASFVEAVLNGATFADGTTLVAADMTGADLRSANLGGCDLTGARLQRARLDQANFGMARMVGCNAHLAQAPGAMMRKTVLTNAVLTGAILQNAILQHADLRGTDLRAANLYGADLARVLRDDATIMSGALLDNARTWPRLPMAPV